MPEDPRSPSIPRAEPTVPAVPAARRDAETRKVQTGELPAVRAGQDPDPKPWNEVLIHLGKMEERRRDDAKTIFGKIDGVATGQTALRGEVAQVVEKVTALESRVETLEAEVHRTNNSSSPGGLASIPITYIPATPPPPSIPNTPSSFERQASGPDLKLQRDIGMVIVALDAVKASAVTKEDLKTVAAAAAKEANDAQLAAVVAKIDSWGNTKWGQRILTAVGAFVLLALGVASTRLQACQVTTVPSAVSPAASSR